jgi:flagellar protein FliS
MHKFDQAHEVREEYLTSQVMTATPFKLHQMLVQGALRNCLRARDDFQHGELELGGEMILKAQEIVGSLLTGVSEDKTNPLGKKVAAIYVYIFRTLMNVYRKADLKQLDDAISILEIENETWAEVCAKFGSEQAQAKQRTDELASSGFSFQA